MTVKLLHHLIQAQYLLICKRDPTQPKKKRGAIEYDPDGDSCTPILHDWIRKKNLERNGSIFEFGLWFGFVSKNWPLQRHKSNSSKIELLRRNREKNKNDLNLQTKILISNQLQLKKSTEHLKQQEGFQLIVALW